MRPIRIVGLFLVAVVACSGLPDNLTLRGPDDGEAIMFQGPSHCEWQGTHMLLVKKGTVDDWQMYVRDPEQVPQYRFGGSSDLEAGLPPGAEFSGYSGGGYELWFDPADDSIGYVVHDGAVEAWARAIEWGLCE